MPHWSLRVLVAAAVVCAGVGGVLLQAPPPVSDTGWTFFAPLSHQTYALATPTWTAGRWMGVALLTVGAGTVGAATVALVLRPGGR